ncbi:MAG: beta-glucanase precursor [Gammaproteobacteria bacterium]|nr:beta-glucanase precursor [Gammaproteobacteria bacterium]
MRRVYLLMCLAVMLVGCATTDVTETSIKEAAARVDYGDASSQTLADRAWKALAKKNYPELFAYTRRCVELYGEQGKSMNAGLTDFEPPATAAQKWALNDVGTCLFIMANAYEQLEMYSEASQTYHTLAEDYYYAQCWDAKGWFWRPAEDAARKAKKFRNW